MEFHKIRVREYENMEDKRRKGNRQGSRKLSWLYMISKKQSRINTKKLQLQAATFSNKRPFSKTDESYISEACKKIKEVIKPVMFM